MMHLDVGWMCGGVAHFQNNLHYLSQTRTMERLSTWHQALLVNFSWVQKPLQSCTEGMCRSFICPPNVQMRTSLHVITMPYHAFSHVSTATDKHWGDKAWVRGFINIISRSITSLFMVCATIIRIFMHQSRLRQWTGLGKFWSEGWL